MEKYQWLRLICSLIVSVIVLSLTACNSKEDEILTPPEPSIDYNYNSDENIQDNIESYIDILLRHDAHEKQVSVSNGLINVQVDVYVYSEYEATSLLYISDDITAYIQENFDYDSLSVDVELHYEYLD